MKNNNVNVMGNASIANRNSTGSRTVPVEFCRIVLHWAAEKGLNMSDFWAGLDISPEVLDVEDTWIPVTTHQKLVDRAVALTGSVDGLGYELGMRVGLTTHLPTGYALLSQPTLREVIKFGVKYSKLIVPVYQGCLTEGPEHASVSITLNFTPEPALQYYYHDMALTAVWKALRNLLGEVWPGVALWFDYPEPSYFAEFRELLPSCRFNMESNQLIFPVQQLDRKISTGDPVMAELMARKFQEKHLGGQLPKQIVERVRCELVSNGNGYPDLEVVSRRLCMSVRTLKRHLQQAGTSFQQLLDEARLADATRLLSSSPTMSIEDMAAWFGYSTTSNFTQAFRRWTGLSPSKFRQHLQKTDS